MLRASMRACTMKRKWNKKGQSGKNPHNTKQTYLIRFSVRFFSHSFTPIAFAERFARDGLRVLLLYFSRRSRCAVFIASFDDDGDGDDDDAKPVANAECCL